MLTTFWLQLFHILTTVHILFDVGDEGECTGVSVTGLQHCQWALSPTKLSVGFCTLAHLVGVDRDIYKHKFTWNWNVRAHFYKDAFGCSEQQSQWKQPLSTSVEKIHLYNTHAFRFVLYHTTIVPPFWFVVLPHEFSKCFVSWLILKTKIKPDLKRRNSSSVTIFFSGNFTWSSVCFKIIMK